MTGTNLIFWLFTACSCKLKIGIWIPVLFFCLVKLQYVPDGSVQESYMICFWHSINYNCSFWQGIGIFHSYFILQLFCLLMYDAHCVNTGVLCKYFNSLIPRIRFQTCLYLASTICKAGVCIIKYTKTLQLLSKSTM